MDECLGIILARLGIILARLGIILASLGIILARLGIILARLGIILARLGIILASEGIILAASAATRFSGVFSETRLAPPWRKGTLNHPWMYRVGRRFQFVVQSIMSEQHS